MKTIDSIKNETVLKDGSEIKFEDIKKSDTIEIDGKKYIVIQSPYLSLDLPEGTLQADVKIL